VNIALANQIAAICEKLGISAWEVIRLANLHPRVNLHLPGPGVGGHCLAVDPWFLAEGFPEEARLVVLAREINDARPLSVVARLQEILNGVARPKVAVLGAAYKGNVDDVRESPALAICRALEEAGISFSVYDPYVKSFPYELVGLPAAFSGADCALVVADHAEFRYLHPGELGRLMGRRLLFDTRNCLDHALWRAAGFEAHVLGAGREKSDEAQPQAPEPRQGKGD
jgi:UDP-N-acetyl-D-mannosaminuronic acid dehydrogenase